MPKMDSPYRNRRHYQLLRLRESFDEGGRANPGEKLNSVGGDVQKGEQIGFFCLFV